MTELVFIANYMYNFRLDKWLILISLSKIFADALQHGASQFEQQAGKLKRKYWWKNLKVLSTFF